MTLKYNEEAKGFDIVQGDWAELAQFIEDAEEVLHDPVNDIWEIDGVRFAGGWFSEQMIMMTHFMNVVSHMNLRKGVLTGNNKMAKKLLDIQHGKVPGLPGGE